MEGREEKRPYMKWTLNLDEKFNEAIRRLGEKATAKPILEYMNVPQLSRKHVENRLQKYRVQKRQAQLAQHTSSSIANLSKITSQTPPSIVPGSYSNVLNSNDFLMNFNKPPQEPYLPQARAIPSLVPPNEFFTGLDDLIQNLELELYSKMTENQIDTYHTRPHLNMFNHMEDNGINPSNVLNLSEFHINFNEPLQQEYLPQPPAVPSLVPLSSYFAGLNGLNQNVGLNYFSGNMTEDQISTYFNTDNGNHSNVLKTKEFTMTFNEPPQEIYLPQPHVVPSLVSPNDLFTRLKDPLSSNSTQDNISTRNQNP